jgi:hypothetical protein
VDALKAKIEQLKARLAELKAGEQTAENAALIIEARAELNAATAELAVLVEAFEGDDGETEEAEVEAPAEEEAPAEVEAPAETPAEPEVEAPAGPVALAASATDTPPVEDEPVAAMVLTASAGTSGVTPGTSLERGDVMRVLQAASAGAGHLTNGKVRMFEIDRWGDDADAPSETKSAIENTRILREARNRHVAGESTRPVALTAANCFCGPTELIREQGVVGDRGRPVAGLFPSIPLRGAFRAMSDLAFNVDNAGSTVQWTCDDQDLVDPGDPLTWKPCTELDCFTEDEYVPYMVVACTTVRRQHRWAHPEQIERWLELLMVEYDSVAETILLDTIEADAGAPLTVGAAGNLMEQHGLLAKLHYALGSLSYSLGYEFRSSALAGHTVIAPRGMTDAILADEKLRGFPSGVRSSAELVTDIEQSYGVRLVERMDEPTSRKADAAATVAALNAGGAIDGITTPLLPPTFRLMVLDTSQWVHGEGVLVGADWHVDIDLLKQNKMTYFLENVEILERLGARKSYLIDVPGVIAGSYTDLVAPPIP